MQEQEDAEMVDEGEKKDQEEEESEKIEIPQ